MRRSIAAKQEIIETLQRMHLLDAAVGQEFGDVVELAKEISGASAAFLSFGFEDWQRIVPSKDTPHFDSIFARCVGDLLQDGELGRQAGEAFCVLDLAAAPDMQGRAYSVASILLHAGYQCIGSLNVTSQSSLDLSARQLKLLTGLGKQLSAQLENRWQVTMQTRLNARLTDSLARAAGTKSDAMLAASRLETLFQGLPIACFTFDLELNVMEWNKSAEKLFGIPAHEAASQSIYEVLSNSRISRRATPYIEAIMGGKSVSDVEWTYRRNDGKRLRISTSSFPMYGKRQEVVGAISAHVDLTDLWEHGIALGLSENRLRTVIASMRDGVIVQDRHGGILIANQSAERILGLSRAEIETNSATEDGLQFIRPDGAVLPSQERPSQIAFSTGQAVHDYLIGIDKSDGTTAWMEVDAVPLFQENSKNPVSMVCTFSDVTRRVDDERIIQEQLASLRDYSHRMDLQQVGLEEANRRLEALATTDGLTELLNHRTFQDALEREMRLANRNQTEMSLIFLDIDAFKSFNDQFGHQAGDEVLTGVARLLKRTVRDTDIVARYGGEELVVVLPDTGREGAIVIAESLRITLEQANWKHRRVTASFGVTTLRPDILDRQALIEQADRALYHSKAMGRNRVTHFENLPDSAIRSA